MAGAEELLKEGDAQAETGREADFAMRASERRVKKAGPLPDAAIKYVEGREA